MQHQSSPQVLGRDQQRQAAIYLLRAYALLHGLPVDETKLDQLNMDSINGFAIDLAISEVGSILRILGIEPASLILADIDLALEVSRF